MKKVYFLVSLSAVLIFLVTGCQKKDDNEIINTIYTDMKSINNILKNQYQENNTYKLNSKEMEQLFLCLDNITENMYDLQNFKRIVDDENLYNALKILTELEVAVLLTSDDIKMKKTAKLVLEMLRLSTTQLISLKKAGVDIRKYLKNYRELSCIGASCGHINAVIEGNEYITSFATLKLDSKDKIILENLKLSLQAAWTAYLLHSDGVNSQQYRKISSIYLPYLSDKKILNDETLLLMKDLIKYRISKSINFIYTGNIYPKAYITSSKYLDSYYKKYGKKEHITDADMQEIKQDRNYYFSSICANPSFLFENEINECIEYINKKSTEEIFEIFTDYNINSDDSYIMIDNKVCMINTDGKNKFYSNDKICKAIKAKLK